MSFTDDELLLDEVAEYLYDKMCGEGCHKGGWGQTYKDDATNGEKEEYGKYAKGVISFVAEKLIMDTQLLLEAE